MSFVVLSQEAWSGSLRGDLEETCNNLRVLGGGLRGLGKSFGDFGRLWDTQGDFGRLGETWQNLGGLRETWATLGDFRRSGKLLEIWRELGRLEDTLSPW